MPTRNIASIGQIEHDLRLSGAKNSHIRQIFRAWLGRTSWDAPAWDAYPKALAEKLPSFRGTLESFGCVLITRGNDNTRKLLIGLQDGQCVETVILPRDALCVSTQVGCAVGCLFCSTGKSGLIRQLTSAEIVFQVREALRINPRLKKVVFMGMGEPSHNLKNVAEAVRFLGDALGMAHKEIVISSVGDRRLFDAMPTWSVKPAFALSLHTTDEAKRRRLLPHAPAISVQELIERTLDYAQKTKYPAQIEWTLIEGVNDSKEDVKRLAELLDPRLAMVNFIAVNAVAGSPFKRPAPSHMQDLITILREKGFVATLRESAAQEIEGGCGQLRARVLGETEHGTP